jgi:pimeloyl-ACP methyl ester carboxylesterase
MIPGWRGIGAWVTRASDLPIFGAVLYSLNVNAPVIRMMARGHVFSDPNWLMGERLQQKMAVTSAPGARYASIRFVTGMLDLMSDRESFIELATCVKDPILVLYGAETPWRSKAEMETLASLHHVEAAELPHGKLAVHEEFPEAIVEAMKSFLRAASGGSKIAL